MNKKYDSNIKKQNKWLAALKMLIERGLDIKATNYYGQSPMHVCASKHTGLACALILLPHYTLEDLVYQTFVLICFDLFYFDLFWIAISGVN